MTEYRIYVASLSDYNSGNLHGAWIDCDGKNADELQDEVNAILRTSRYPNVMVPCCDAPEECTCGSCGRSWCFRCNPTPASLCPFCNGGEGRAEGCQVPSAEEYAIHDHEGFDDLVGEHTSLAEVAELVDTLEMADDPDAFKAFMSHSGLSHSEAREYFDEAYYGQWDSERAFAEDWLDSVGYLADVPDSIARYFDYEAFARDLFMDYSLVDGYVFTNNW